MGTEKSIRHGSITERTRSKSILTSSKSPVVIQRGGGCLSQKRNSASRSIPSLLSVPINAHLAGIRQSVQVNSVILGDKTQLSWLTIRSHDSRNYAPSLIILNIVKKLLSSRFWRFKPRFQILLKSHLRIRRPNRSDTLFTTRAGS